MRRIESAPAGQGSTGHNNRPDAIALDAGDFYRHRLLGVPLEKSSSRVGRRIRTR
ncbi:hypothetical protein [Streptomyces incanus]|uniref:Uncharacterized protein n=1 Tax=Streptomyces incanus TaxID=887453 RepID=A0ABW0XTI1_9ACTN